MTIKLAVLPGSRLPSVLYAPAIVAGVNVSALRAFSSVRPYSIVLRTFSRNLERSLSPFEVSAKVIPAVCSIPALAGAISQCFSSVSDTLSAS